MPIDPKRVEAAARALADEDGPIWDGLTDEIRKEYIKHVADVAGWLFPELASDPPTAWVAPWEATEAMEDEADAVVEAREHVGLAMKGAGGWIFGSMRAAHTKEQG